MFDGFNPTLAGDVYIVVEGRRIGAVTSEPPPGVDVTDLGDVTVMPGMVDTHVHLAWDASAEPELRTAFEHPSLVAIETMRHGMQHLAAGVTTVRDVGSPGGQAIAVGESFRRRLVAGPRVVAAGQPICMTGGHVWRHLSQEADGPDALRAAVRTQVRAGARMIKLMASGGICGDADERPGVPELSLSELAAATDEAHRLGYPVAAHAHSLLAIRNAISAGVDSIEHGSALDIATAELMVETGVMLSPTVTAVRSLTANGSKLHVPGHVLAKARAAQPPWIQSTTMAIDAGVLIVAGTDAGVPGRAHGEVAEEVAFLGELGLPALEALRACTSRAADLLGMGDQIGRISEGLTADLVAVDGDPIEDLNALGRVRTVVADGRLFEVSQLREVLDREHPE